MLRKDLTQEKINKIFAEFDNDDVIPEKPPKGCSQVEIARKCIKFQLEEKNKKF